MSIVEGFSTWNKELYSDPQHSDAGEEEFMMYQGLSKENILKIFRIRQISHISTTEKDFYRMDIIWGCFRYKYSILESVALAFLLY